MSRDRLRRIGRFAVRSLLGVGTLLLVLVVALAVILAFGLTIDVTRWREPIAERLSASFGRPVAIDGQASMRVSLQPTIKVAGLRIANPAGFAGPTFIAIGEASATVDLVSFARQRIVVREVRAADVRIDLEERGDGAVNWAFAGAAPRAGPDSEPSAPKPASEPVQPETQAHPLSRIVLDQLMLERVMVTLVRPAFRHALSIDRLDAQAPAGQPVKVAVQGSVDRAFPYAINLDAAPLAEMVTRGKPWKFDAALSFLGTAVHSSGSLVDILEGPTAEVGFGAGTPNLDEVERLLKIKLPKVGASALAGSIKASPGRIELIELRGAMGRTTLAGDLTFDTGGARPRLTGSLLLPALDLRPFLLDAPDQGPETPQSLADVYRELEQVTLDLRELQSFDADVKLSVERWLSLPGDVRDAALHVQINNGVLQAPLSWTIAGVPLTGSIAADGIQATPEVSLQLGTRKSELGGLAQLILGIRGVKGTLDRLDVRIAAKGERVRELVRSLNLRVGIDGGKLSYGNVDGGKPVDLKLDSFELRVPPNGNLNGTTRGALAGQAFKASFAGGPIERLVREGRSPFKLDLDGTGIRAQLNGQIATPDQRDASWLDFELSAARARDAALWLGLAASGQAPVSLKGQARFGGGEQSLRKVALRLGKTVLDADVALSRVNGRPFVKARLSFDRIDADELQSILPQSSESGDRPIIEIPILPAGVDLTDSDIDVVIKRIDGPRLPITDVAFDARIRNGEMQPSVFRAKVAEAQLNGALALDLRSAEPKAELWLAGENVDLGRMLQRLEVARRIEARAGVLQLHLVARASRFGDMLRRSNLVAKIEAGRVAIRDVNTQGALRIDVREIEFRADADQPLKLALTGAVDETPVKIQVETATLRELFSRGSRVPLSVVTEAAEARLSLAGTVALASVDRDVELSLSIQGARFDRLSNLARVPLPPWGPYTVVGRFLMSKRGYEARDFSFIVGESVLTGSGVVDTTRTKPRLNIQLAAERVQLDDFPISEWSVLEGSKSPKPATAPKPAGLAEARSAITRASDQIESVLSREVLNRQDARLAVVIKQVLSGKDQLGNGRLVATIESGRAQIEPIEVAVPGGSARLSLAYEPGPSDVGASLRIAMDSFDYGILARRLRPEADLFGRLNLDIEVAGRAAHLNEMLKHGNGKIDFAVWPERMQAGIFDLWAVNLFVALMPVVDQSLASRMNCAIGHFDLKQGKLDAQRLLMDTSRMRVIGVGGADFATESIGIRLAPRPKEPQFFSLATPVAVGGTFSEYEIQLSPWEIAETVFRTLASVVIVPFQMLFAERLPADGKDVCASGARPPAKPVQ